MGLNHFATAAMIALLGAASVVHAETASQPASPATAAPASDPALQASPIAGSEPAAQPSAPATPSAPTPETTAPAQTKGDVLTVPKQKPAAAKKNKASSTPIRIVEDGMPGRGASMSQVEQHFGPPQEKLAPVGTPPITRWIYRDYTVYFEHEYVIHSVRNTGAAEPAAPAAATPASPAAQPAAPSTPGATSVQPAAPATPEAPAVQPATPATPEAPAAQPATEPPATVAPAATQPATGK